MVGLVVSMAFVVSLATPPLFVPLLRRLAVIDVPNFRSSHTVPTVRGAGLAPAAGVLVALVLTSLSGLGGEGKAALVAVTVVALVMAGIGLIEDVRGLRVRVRVLAQGTIAAALVSALFFSVGGSPWWVPVMAVAVTAYVNAANFMDGVDGISALHGLVAGVHFAFVGVLMSQTGLLLTGAVTAAVFVAFAPWNLLRGRVFLGDVGSYLLGALVAGCAVWAFFAGSSGLLALAPLLPYLADTFLTFLGRARRSEPIFEAHRSHIYQRLTALGLRHLESATIVAVASALCSAFALAGSAAGGAAVTAGAHVGVLAVLVAYACLPRLVGSRPRQGSDGPSEG